MRELCPSLTSLIEAVHLKSVEVLSDHTSHRVTVSRQLGALSITHATEDFTTLVLEFPAHSTLKRLDLSSNAHLRYIHLRAPQGMGATKVIVRCFFLLFFCEAGIAGGIEPLSWLFFCEA